MDIEFHYYMTYLIAARAGFTPAEAAIGLDHDQPGSGVTTSLAG